MNLEELLKAGYEANASDLHLIPGRPAMFRINGAMQSYGEEDITLSEQEEILNVLLTKMQRKKLEQFQEIEVAGSFFGQFRIRINIFKQQDSYALAIRLLAHKIPDPKEIFLPSKVIELMEEKKGLILIAGESGCGKTTTAASLLNYIASKKRKRIITVEDPVEYLIFQGISMVSQREISSVDKAYADAIKAAAHQDADVIFIGRLTNEQTILEAAAAAESGHLVISTVHTFGAENTLKWLIDSCSDFRREEIQRRISGILKGIVTQQLLPSCDMKSRNAVFEVLLAEKEILMLIREGRIFQIFSAMEKKSSLGMQTMDDAVLAAYMQSLISSETAIFCAYDKDAMQHRMKIY